MIGESLLIAPVYEQNARGRYVYLPEEMLQLSLIHIYRNRNRSLVAINIIGIIGSVGNAAGQTDSEY